MGRILTSVGHLAAFAVLASLSAACDDEVRQVVVAENLAPTAKITGPERVGIGDLVRFDGSESKDQDGRIDGYAWNFGDGAATASSAVAFNVWSDVGTYMIELTVTDNRGATDTATHAVEVLQLPDNQPPLAVITAPAVGDPGVPVNFDGRMSSDPDGTIERYEWTLGVGGPAAMGPQVSHTFVNPGLYEVELVVTDDRGARSTTTHSIDIGAPPGDRPPVANAGLDQNVGVGEVVNFDGTASFDPDGTIVDYTWNFGDGATISGMATTTHTYNVESTFRVTLTVTDDQGLMSSDTATITVGAVSIDGEYSMVANPNMTTCGGLPATFAATTISFVSNGAMLTSTTPNPEMGLPDIIMTGTLTGANFSVAGTTTDSQGGTHDISLVGAFMGRQYTATMTESISIAGISLCTLTWQLSGDRI